MTQAAATASAEMQNNWNDVLRWIQKLRIICGPRQRDFKSKWVFSTGFVLVAQAAATAMFVMIATLATLAMLATFAKLAR